jgi:hypothetical protein
VTRKWKKVTLKLNQMLFSSEITKRLADLQRENGEIRCGIGDVYKSLIEIKNQDRRYSFKNDNHSFGFIMDKIDKLQTKSKEGED